MKKNLLFTLIAIAAIFSSCKNDDAAVVTVPESNLPDYTIMLYGTGGGNLDDAFNFDLLQAEEYGYSANRQFVAKFKYSTEYQMQNEDSDGIMLYTLTPDDGFAIEKVDDNTFLLNEPKNIADFINETKEKYPAKNYILIFWNHGSTFDILDQPVKSSYDLVASTKSLLNDDTTDTAVSIFEIEAALSMTTGVDLIYFDTCLMSNIESLYQIKDHTRYILGSAHLVPELGGNYAQFMASLDKYSNIEDAMCNYVAKIDDYWKSILNDARKPRDMTLIKTSSLNQLATAISEYREAFCEIYADALEDYNNGDTTPLYTIEYVNGRYDGDDDYFDYNYDDDDKTIDEFVYPTGGGVLYFLYPSLIYRSYTVEPKSAFANIATYLGNGLLSSKSTKISNAFDDVVVAENHYNVPIFVDCVSPSITWVSHNRFAADWSEIYPYIEVKTLSELYKMTAFDKATGWSKFLEMNQLMNVDYNEYKTLDIVE